MLGCSMLLTLDHFYHFYWSVKVIVALALVLLGTGNQPLGCSIKLNVGPFLPVLLETGRHPLGCCRRLPGSVTFFTPVAKSKKEISNYVFASKAKNLVYPESAMANINHLLLYTPKRIFNSYMVAENKQQMTLMIKTILMTILLRLIQWKLKVDVCIIPWSWFNNGSEPICE